MAGCGSGAARPAAVAVNGLSLTGSVHGGQQPLVGARVYLYAISTTANVGAATSLLNGTGFVLTDLSGSFSITGDYTCPAGAYVYLLAVAGNPGLTLGMNNSAISLAAGLGACSSLTPATFTTINEISTVAMTSAVANFATSSTQIGITDPTLASAAFDNINKLIDSVHGVALAPGQSTPGVPQAEINSLADALSSCINSSGSNSTCSALFSAATTSSNTPSDTFQAALNIARNPAANVNQIFALTTANGPFEPSLTAAPCSWMIVVPNVSGSGASSGTGSAPCTLPPFFNGETALGSGVYYLQFPNGNYFGYYSFLSQPGYLYHFDLGYEYYTDANDGLGGIYFYDFASGHTFYTSATYPFPYLYDFTLNTMLYYYPDPNNPGHYNTNGVRYFYNFATGQIITL